MILFLLYWTNYQNNDVLLGVFSTEEKAEEYRSKHYDKSVINFRIEEDKLDKVS